MKDLFRLITVTELFSKKPLCTNENSRHKNNNNHVCRAGPEIIQLHGPYNNLLVKKELGHLELCHKQTKWKIKCTCTFVSVISKSDHLKKRHRLNGYSCHYCAKTPFFFSLTAWHFPLSFSVAEYSMFYPTLLFQLWVPDMVPLVIFLKRLLRGSSAALINNCTYLHTRLCFVQDVIARSWASVLTLHHTICQSYIAVSS